MGAFPSLFPVWELAGMAVAGVKGRHLTSLRERPKCGDSLFRVVTFKGAIEFFQRCGNTEESRGGHRRKRFAGGFETW